MTPQLAISIAPFGEPEISPLALGMTVQDVIDDRGVSMRLPTVVAIRNGDDDPFPIMRAEWTTRVVAPGETLTFIALPGKSSSSSGGKQVVGLIASLALALAAPAIGGALATALHFGQGAAAIASGAFMPAGPVLLNLKLKG